MERGYKTRRFWGLIVRPVDRNNIDVIQCDKIFICLGYRRMYRQHYIPRVNFLDFVYRWTCWLAQCECILLSFDPVLGVHDPSNDLKKRIVFAEVFAFIKLYTIRNEG